MTQSKLPAIQYYQRLVGVAIIIPLMAACGNNDINEDHHQKLIYCATMSLSPSLPPSLSLSNLIFIINIDCFSLQTLREREREREREGEGERGERLITKFTTSYYQTERYTEDIYTIINGY